jgi:hypothetical protein
MTACKNCDRALPEQAFYCPFCGQSVKEVNRPWLEAARELLTELFDFDGRMLVSLRLLMTKPGFLSLEYIRGRRASYTSPLRMYLVISLAFFFILPMILPDSPVTPPEHEFSADRYSQGMFVLVPLFALILKVFYRETLYLAHLVFTVYLFSAVYIVFAATMSIEASADRFLAVMLLQVILLLYLTAYMIVALHVTYQQSWLRSSLKFVGLILIYLPILAGAIELASH